MRIVESSNVLSYDVRGKISDKYIEDYADQVSDRVMIRSYDYGCSRDEWRETTPKEHIIIKKVIEGAIHNIRFGRDIQATADAAEFIAMGLLDFIGEEVNTYDTIYLPIKRFGDIWLKEEDPG